MCQPAPHLGNRVSRSALRVRNQPSRVSRLFVDTIGLKGCIRAHYPIPLLIDLQKR
jgi:hypothetical protein